MSGLLAGRALLSFLVLPGLVAFLVPWLLIEPHSSGRRDPIGIGILIIGTAGLVWCAIEFYRRGRGTLAPWDPPKHLVATGLYGLSRNPMYVAVALILWGWAVTFSSWPLAAYAAVVMMAFHLRVVYGEEPWLAKRHGEHWVRYRQQVPRWLGRRGER